MYHERYLDLSLPSVGQATAILAGLTFSFFSQQNKKVKVFQMYS